VSVTIQTTIASKPVCVHRVEHLKDGDTITIPLDEQLYQLWMQRTTLTAMLAIGLQKSNDETWIEQATILLNTIPRADSNPVCRSHSLHKASYDPTKAL
jgi:hypothetical protein